MSDLTDNSRFAYLLLGLLDIYYIRIYIKMPYKPEYNGLRIQADSLFPTGIFKGKKPENLEIDNRNINL